MSIEISSDSTGINAILGSQTTQVEEEEDPLGRDAFLTMLVAQLEHQDPLNPLDGTDFSAQLAQFSTLEQMFTVNDNLESIQTALGSSSEQNLLDLIGKEVTFESNSLNLENGEAIGGYFTIGEDANVVINIYDDTGVYVAQIAAGQKDAGTYSIEWNGTDDYGDTMSDGSYSYEVIAVDDNYETVDVVTTLSSTVTGVTYEYGSAYLLMGDQLVDPATVTRVDQASDEA